MSIKVSIIVPVYNVAPYLTACIDSLCKQTLQDIEIIVINDNSTDNSLELLQAFAREDDRIKIINHTTNEGTAAARNHGLSAAIGEYVGFVDGDDYLDRDFYEKLYSLAIGANADIAKGLTRTISTNGTIETARDNDRIIVEGKFAFMGHLLTAIYRRSMLKSNNVRFHVDFFCFQIQAVYFANKIVCCNETFYNYVRHKGSCDSDIFTIEKWVRLNLGHADFIYDWVHLHPYDEKTKNLYLNRAKNLYFYGFNKLNKADVPAACQILAQKLRKGRDGNAYSIKKLRRQLYRKNKLTSIIDYYISILKGQI